MSLESTSGSGRGGTGAGRARRTALDADGSRRSSTAAPPARRRSARTRCSRRSAGRAARRGSGASRSLTPASTQSRPARARSGPAGNQESIPPACSRTDINLRLSAAAPPSSERRAPSHLVPSIDDGTVEGDTLLGVHGSVGADPLGRSPTGQFDSSHGPDCTDRSVASRPLSPVMLPPWSRRPSAPAAPSRCATPRSGRATPRRFDGRVLVGLFAVEDGLARACAWQQADGRIELRSHSEEALEQLLATLPLEADHSEFLQRFADDPMLGRTSRRSRQAADPRRVRDAGARSRRLRAADHVVGGEEDRAPADPVGVRDGRRTASHRRRNASQAARRWSSSGSASPLEKPRRSSV